MSKYNEPSQYGLKHSDWRKNQRETIGFIEDIQQIGIIEAMTGSGKTALVRAISEHNKVIALMQTKFLQAENYANGYGFMPMYGKSNYSCVYPLAEPGATVSECMYQDKSMSVCPVHSECTYIRAKSASQSSQRAALNYPFWMHVYNNWPAPDYLFCDEAHELPELVREWAGATIVDRDMREWGLPQIPIIVNTGPSLLAKASYVPVDRARAYLDLCIDQMNTTIASLSSDAKIDPQMRRQMQKAELFQKKLQSTRTALDINDKDWFIKSGPNASFYDGKYRWAFVCKPLSAKYFFSQWFRGNYKTVLMSGTIGDFKTFAEELGIENYQSTRVPSVYPANVRPIFDLEVPRMGQKSKDTDWQFQAQRIKDAIQQCDPEWHGLIHVTSKAESARLAQRLSKLGLEDRLFVMPDNLSTEKQVAKWQQEMNKKPGRLGIAWNLWAGYDGTKEKINIVAKAPFGFLGDEYTVARQRANGSFYLLEAAQMLVQGLGRIRRGNPEDYDGETRSKFVAIADGGWKWLRNYMSPDILESVKTL